MGSQSIDFESQIVIVEYRSLTSVVVTHSVNAQFIGMEITANETPVSGRHVRQAELSVRIGGREIRARARTTERGFTEAGICSDDMVYVESRPELQNSKLTDMLAMIYHEHLSARPPTTTLN